MLTAENKNTHTHTPKTNRWHTALTALHTHTHTRGTKRRNAPPDISLEATCSNDTAHMSPRSMRGGFLPTHGSMHDVPSYAMCEEKMGGSATGSRNQWLSPLRATLEASFRQQDHAHQIHKTVIAGKSFPRRMNNFIRATTTCSRGGLAEFRILLLRLRLAGRRGPSSEVGHARFRSRPRGGKTETECETEAAYDTTRNSLPPPARSRSTDPTRNSGTPPPE